MKPKFSRAFAVLFVFLIIFNMQSAFAFSYSDSLGNSSPAPLNESTQAQESAVQIYDNVPLELLSQAYLAEAVTNQPSTAPLPEARFSCNTKSLTPEEVQRFKQEITDKGVKVGNIGSGVAANAERKSLPQDKIILTDDKETTAVKQELPSKEMDLIEISDLLNQHVKGAFAIGLKLDDTLRVARCVGIPSASCPVDGGNLKWRNSGSGIKADFGNAFNDLFGGKKFVEGMSKEELDLLQTRAQQDGIDAQNTTEYVRIPGNPIKNYIKSDVFSAKMVTNCTGSNDASCTINVYSMFDKYFNSYFSANMVVSSIAPTLLGRAAKMFGWMGRRGLSIDTFLPKQLKGKIADMKTALDKSIMTSKIGKKSYLSDISPSSIYGDIRIKRAMTNIDKYDFKDAFHATLFSRDAKSLTGGGFNGWLGGKEGKEFLDSLASDPERRKAFLDVVTDFKGYFSTVKTMKTIEFDKAFGKTGVVKDYLGSQTSINPHLPPGTRLSITSPREEILAALNNPGADEARKGLVTYGQNLTKLVRNVDDSTAMDLGELIQKNDEFGLSKFAVRNSATGEYVHMQTNPRLFKENLEDVFAKEGKFGDLGFDEFGKPIFSPKAKLETNGEGALKLFKVDPAGKLVGEITPADLEATVMQGKYAQTFVKLKTGEFVPLNPTSLGSIKAGTTGNIKLYESGWVDAGVLTPEDYSLRLVDRMDYYLAKPSGNLGQLQNTLIERGFTTGRYASLLDKAMKQDQALVKNYFNPFKGGARWTVLPFAYWEAKRGGADFGIQNLSAYELPDKWFRIAYEAKSQPIYNDAMVDFFGNEGSDQGDIFVQVLNLGLWKQLIDSVSGKYPPAQQAIDKVTGKSLRSNTEDLAVYISGPKNCDTCNINLSSNDNLQTVSPSFYSSQPMNTYILEAPTLETFKKKGQTLISFTRHMDLAGQAENIPGDRIPMNISSAASAEGKKTCAEAISGTNMLGLPIGKILPKNAKVGLALSIGESVGYLVFNFAGIAGSAVQQLQVMPQLQDCIDTEGGYYTHIMIPPKEEEKKPTSVTQYSTQNVTKLIEDNAQKYLDSLKGTDNKITKGFIEESQKQLDKITGNALDNQIAEALAHTDGSASGKLAGYKMFFFWCEGGCELTPSSYLTNGKEILVDAKNKVTVEADREKGILSANGTPIITNADAVRLENINTQIPAKEIPNTLTYLGLPNTNELYFQMTASGGMIVKNSDVLNCLQSGVKAQTGIGLVTNDLKEAFGPVDSVATDIYPLIKPLGDKIIAEGYPRKQASGQNAVLDIYGDRNTQLSPMEAGIDKYAGKLISIQFQNGVIVWKPSTNELVVWLKHHEKAILVTDDVKGLKATKTTTKNALTDCTEPAINLAVQGDPNSELSQLKAQQFNQSLDNFGPFQSFETPERMYIFYSKKEGGECKEYFKVLNKKTGQVETDSQITSFSQDGSKLEIKTADGKTHTLEFSADTGVPNLQYNGNPKEILTSAQGKKGAFYYDPEKGLWYADNAQLIPLLDAFKQDGYSRQVNSDNSTNAVPGGNPLTLNLPSQQQGLNLLNLPSLPENALLLSLTIIAMLGLIVFVRFRITKTRKTKN